MGPYAIAEGGEHFKRLRREIKFLRICRMPNIDLAVDLGLGTGEARLYTCDLTHDYISINADYRS